MAPFETFDHTADVGLRVEADSLDELFSEAGRGLLSLAVENPESVRLSRQVHIELEAEDLESLFIDWLRELVYRMVADRLLLAEFQVRVRTDRPRLWATARGEPADWGRHLPGSELKAVTYHGLKVRPKDGGWTAEVIFDI